MADSTASIGLRIYLQDEITSGLGDVGAGVLDLSKSFVELASSIGVTSQAITDSMKSALDATNALSETLQANLGAAAKDATSANTALAESEDKVTQASSTQADTQSQAAQAAKEALSAQAALTDVLDQNAQAVQAVTTQTQNLQTATFTATQTAADLGITFWEDNFNLRSLTEQLDIAFGAFQGLTGAEEAATLGMTSLRDNILATESVLQEFAAVDVAVQQTFAQALVGVGQAGQAAEAEIQALVSRYMDLYDATDKASLAEKDQITAQLEALGAGDALKQSLMDLASIEDEVATKTQNAREGFGGMYQQFMGLMIGQQVFQQLNTALDGAATSAGNLEDSFIRADIATQATGDDVGILNGAIVQMSDESEFSTQQIADGFQLMGERGYDTTAIVKDGLGQAVINLATVTGQGLVPNVNLLTTALRDFGAPASDAESYAAALDYAFFHGIPNVEGLQSALEHVGPSAAILKVPFSTITSMLVYLSQHGMPDVTQAGTGLNYMLMALSAPTSQAGKDMQALGISAYDAHGNLKAIPDILQQLMEKMATLPNSKAAEDFRQMFNIKSGQVARILALDPNVKTDLEDIINQISATQKPNATGKDGLQQQVDKLGGDFNQSMAKLGSTFNSTMGMLFIPVVQWLTPLVNDLNGLVTSVGNANPQVRTFISFLAGFLLVLAPIALAVLGVALAVVVLDTALTPVLIIVGILAGLAVVAALIAANWGPISKLFAPLGPLFQQMGQIIGQTVNPMIVQMKDGWHEIMQALGPLLEQLKSFTPIVVGLGMMIGALVTGVLSALMPTLGGVIHMIAGIIAGIINIVTGVIMVVKGVVQVIVGFVTIIVGLFAWLFGGNSTILTAGRAMFIKGLGNIVGGLLHIVQGVFQAIGAVIVGFITTSLAFFGHLITGIIGFFAGPNIAATLNKTIDGLIAIISAFPAKAMKWVQDLINGIVGWFQHMADVLYVHSIVPDTVNAIVGLFKWLHDLGMAIIQGFIQGIIFIFSTLPKSVLGSITGMISTIGSALSSGGGAVGGWVHDHIITPITSGITGLINQAEQWGANLLKMLGQGIMNGVAGLMSQVNGVANNIKNTLGFHSPTKEGPLSDSDQYMPNMMKMYASGILTHAHLVHGAVNSVASGIASGINTPVVARLQAANAAAVAGAQAGQQSVINLNVDGKTVGTAVFNHLTGQMQLNGMTRSWR